MVKIDVLKIRYDDLERQHRAIFRKCEWLERQLLQAPTSQEFDLIEAQLEEQERALKELAGQLSYVRALYTAAELAQRCNICEE